MESAEIVSRRWLKKPRESRSLPATGIMESPGKSLKIRDRERELTVGTSRQKLPEDSVISILPARAIHTKARRITRIRG
jgi:hypothetical protein